jgi:hypothetical protein
MLKQLAIFLYQISSPGHALLIAAIASWIGAILVELLRVEGEGKSGVLMLLRHYARCSITRTSTVACRGSNLAAGAIPFAAQSASLSAKWGQPYQNRNCVTIHISPTRRKRQPVNGFLILLSSRQTHLVLGWLTTNILAPYSGGRT